jgi:hypothetical protein
LGWLKKFGPAQNILRPLKGQGISSTNYVLTLEYWIKVQQIFFKFWVLAHLHAYFVLHKHLVQKFLKSPFFANFQDPKFLKAKFGIAQIGKSFLFTQCPRAKWFF